MSGADHSFQYMPEIGSLQLSPNKYQANSPYSPDNPSNSNNTNSNKKDVAAKRSIIKINKKKLPSDFFSSEKKNGGFADAPYDRDYEDNNIPAGGFTTDRQNSKHAFRNALRHQPALLSEREIPSQQELGLQMKQEMRRDRIFSTDKYLERPRPLQIGSIRNAALVGLAITQPLSARKQRVQQIRGRPLAESSQLRQRNYYTRSSQKREKPSLTSEPQRKYTAATSSNRRSDEPSLLMHGQERIDQDSSVFFGGTFAKDSFAPARVSNQGGRVSPTKQRLEKRIDFEALKLDANRLRVNFAQVGLDSPVVRKSSGNSEGLMANNNSGVSTSMNSNGANQGQSPLLRRDAAYGSAKKDFISPVKIIVSTHKNEALPVQPNQNGFDITFFNNAASSTNKTSLLPPINNYRS